MVPGEPCRHCIWLNCSTRRSTLDRSATWIQNSIRIELAFDRPHDSEAVAKRPPDVHPRLQLVRSADEDGTPGVWPDSGAQISQHSRLGIGVAPDAREEDAHPRTSDYVVARAARHVGEPRERGRDVARKKRDLDDGAITIVAVPGPSVVVLPQTRFLVSE